MKQDNIYISIIAIIFTALVCVFDFLPRSTFSILEKRDLKQFPKYSFESLRTGDFTKNINSWFSDSEPYRDFFMMISMKQKSLRYYCTWRRTSEISCSNFFERF